MPYTVIQIDGKGWCVAKKGSSDPINSGACHAGKQDAIKQMVAIMLSEERAKHAASMSAFSLPAEADASDDEWVYRSGPVFLCGAYPDKQFDLTPEEATAAAEVFTGCAIADTHAPSVLDGKLGDVLGIALAEDGKTVVGATRIPRWLDDVMAGEPLKVSCEWDRVTKQLHRLALVPNPRVPTAALMNAFADFAGKRHSSQDLKDLQTIHDLAAKQGAECDPTLYPPEVSRTARMSADGRTPAATSGARSATRRPKPMSLKQRLVEWLQGVPDDEAPAPPPAAPVQMSEGADTPGVAELTAALRDAVTAKPPVNREAEDLRKQLARERGENIRNGAARFADERITAEQAFPAEEDALTALFTQLANDDRTLGEGSYVFFDEADPSKPRTRVELLTALFDARPKHGLTVETVPAQADPKRGPQAGGAVQTKPGSPVVVLSTSATTETDAEAAERAEMSDEALDELRAMSPTLRDAPKAAAGANGKGGG